MKKIILFFFLLFSYFSVNAGTEVPVGPITSSSGAYVMFNDGVNGKIITYTHGSPGTVQLLDTNGSVIDSITTSLGVGEPYEMWKLGEFTYAGNKVVIAQLVSEGYFTNYIVYSQDQIVRIGLGNATHFNFASGALYFSTAPTNDVQHYKVELATLNVVTSPSDFNNFYPMWHIAYMQDNGAQIVYYYNNQYYLLNTGRELTGTVLDNDINTEIFNGAFIGGELQRLTMPDQININKSVFRTFASGTSRYYYLSVCRTPSEFTINNAANTGTVTSHNMTLMGIRLLPNGVPNGFYYLENKYYDYLNNGLWIKQLNNEELIDRGSECSEAHSYGGFIGNTPTRIYYIRDNELYYNLLTQEDIEAITGTGVTPGGGGGGNGVGEVVGEDPWEACSISTVTLESFFGCIGTWLSYLTKQILVFFNTIPQFINKFLEMWTTETRSISEIIFPKANADIVNDFMPPRSAGYSDTSIGQMDAMMTGIAYALIIIVALVAILILIKK